MNINNLMHEETMARRENTLKIEYGNRIFNNKVSNFVSDRGIDVLFVDNMDDYSKCTDTVKTFDFTYQADWNYINYNPESEPTDEDYKNNIYYDDYHKRFIVGNKKVINFDFSKEIAEVINTTNYPKKTDKIADDEYDLYPYVSNVYFLIDTGDEANPNHPDITTAIYLDDRDAIALSSDAMISIEPTRDNLPSKFKIRIENNTTNTIYIDNIALGIEVEYYKIKTN
jgi:hypothetical protein